MRIKGAAVFLLLIVKRFFEEIKELTKYAWRAGK